MRQCDVQCECDGFVMVFPATEMLGGHLLQDVRVEDSGLQNLARAQRIERELAKILPEPARRPPEIVERCQPDSLDCAAQWAVIEAPLLDSHPSKRCCAPQQAGRRNTACRTPPVVDRVSRGKSSQPLQQGALERRGFGPHQLAAIRPGIIYVSINCYGHVGPWRERPGWEQLAQTVTGLATAQGSPDRPQRMPVAACDYTTGYLAALGTLVALGRRAREGGSYHVRASLCQSGDHRTLRGDAETPAKAPRSREINECGSPAGAFAGRGGHN